MPDIFFPRLEDMLFLRQPSAHWQVVELQTEPGGCYRNRTGDECLGPGFTKREELLLDEPRIEVIHKRIVYDIEREGDVAKERADAGTFSMMPFSMMPSTLPTLLPPTMLSI